MKKIYKVLCLGVFMVPSMLFAQKPEVTIKKASAAINVDGIGTDAAWSSAPKITIDKPYTGETVVNGDATLQMLYDADNLYVFVNVTDDVVTLDNSADWKGDKFELYIGLPGYVPGAGAGDDHARQFFGNASQSWFDDATKLTHQNWYGEELWPGGTSRATDGVTFAYNETVVGYAYEFKINKSALENVDFATIDSLAFDFTLADNDVVGDGLGVRNRKVFYNTGNLQYANENWSAMDLATLKFEKVVVASKPEVTVKNSSSTIAIDGIGTDAAWSIAPKIAIDKPYAGETVVNCDATFQMLHDADNLYVFVNVKDDVVTLDNSGDWKGDKFELYLGLPGYIPGAGAGDDHARQFFGNASQTWFDDATKLTHQNWYGEELWPGGTARATDGVTFAYNETVDGYAYEFKINKSALENVDFNKIDSLGFDFTLADNDIVGDGLGVRNRKVFYNTGNLKYANENWSAMDLATLKFEKVFVPEGDKPVVTVKKVPSTITVDAIGTDAAWSSAPKIAIDKPYTGETVVNGDATFQMLYDADNLYVFVNVTDDVVTLDNSADWKGDKFELYIGLPGYVPGAGAGDDHARQFFGNASQTWFDDATKLTHQNWYGEELWPGGTTRATDGVTFAYNETVAGYAYEFKINKSALENVNLATIDSLAFDFTLADNDIVGDGLGVRNRKVFYNTGNLQYANENWSAMDLATLIFDKSSSVREPLKSGQTAYITNDILRFKGFESAVDAEIYSIIGQKVIVAKNINEVNVSSLKNGIYLVRVNNGNQAFKVIK